MNNIRIIELYGGPLDGRRHTLADPFDNGLEPDAIMLPCEGGGAWYKRREDGVYVFDKLAVISEETNGPL
jgi:hypothetical protein